MNKALNSFYQEINQPDPQIDLAKAALYMACFEYPDLDIWDYLELLDVMATYVDYRLEPERYPLKVIKTINQYLYEELRFKGNIDDYYNPMNSFLNNVLDLRTGIPITLSLVYLEIAKRIDFKMVGIGMPGHFLIRPDYEEIAFFVDPFNKGEVIFAEDCQERLQQMYDGRLTMNPDFLKPISNRNFLGRMLNNLKLTYLNNKIFDKALATVERLYMLFPSSLQELRDRGLLYYQVGRLSEAVIDLKSYLTQVPDTPDLEVIEQILKQIDN